jgi:hypothetical protein
MKKLLAGFICLFIFACQTDNKDKNTADSTSASAMNPDTLSYSYDSVKVYSKKPVSSNDQVTDTAKAVIVYPKFTDSTLNRFIEARVCNNTSTPDKTYKSYADVTGSFMKSFDEYISYNEDNIQTWFLDVNVSVENQAKDLVVLKFTQVDYMGGAHPNSSFTYVNYDLKEHEAVVLDSLLKPKTFSKLELIAEQIFRKNEGLKPEQSLANTYFFEKDKFHLNTNFKITKEGLEFLYNPYEIKPYAAGVTKLVLPYNVIKDLIKPNSIIYRIHQNASI